jgi:hypothetical protein
MFVLLLCMAVIRAELFPEGNAQQATIAFCEGWVTSAKRRTDGSEAGGSE